MVSAGMKIVKYLLFIFNFVFLVTGIALVVVGALVHTKFKHYFDFVGGSALSVPILLMVVGSIITVIAFFGCCGACKENYCMIITFSIFLTVIFVVELAGGIAAYIYRGQLEDIVSKNMKEGLQNYDKDGYKGVTKTWNAVQHDFDCCGVSNYTNWENTDFYRAKRMYPETCCREDTKAEKDCSKSASNLYTQGCLNKFLDMADRNAAIVGGVGLGIAFVQIMGIIFACCLATAIKREYEVV